jgi:hypothetical protein
MPPRFLRLFLGPKFAENPLVKILTLKIEKNFPTLSLQVNLRSGTLMGL